MAYDLADLKLIAAIADYGSLTRAAERVCLATSSASSRLAHLEAALEAVLFVRHRRGLKPTTAGEVVLRHARQLLARLGQLESDLLAHLDKACDQVTILANATAINYCLPADLASFKCQHPEVRVCLEECPDPEIARAISDGEADLGIVAMEIIPESLVSYPYQKSRMVLVVQVGHALSDASSISFADLLGEPFVCMRVGSDIRTFLLDMASRHGVMLDIRIQVGSFDAMCRMVAAGLGIGLMPMAAAQIQRSSSDQEVALVPIAHSGGEQTLHVCFQRGRRLSVAANGMLNHLRLNGDD